MRISALVDQRIGLLGFGIEGRATLAALGRAGHTRPVRVFVDKPESVDDWPETAQLASADELSELDVLVRSPGFAPHHALRRAADAAGVRQTTAMNLFLGELRAQGRPSIGITGSKGKSTTSTLIHRALVESGVRSVLVGNIGAPALDALEEVVGDRAIPVVELSSYHAADLETAPSIAVLLELFPEHMDWHGTVDAYYEAKMQIALRQEPADRFFYLKANRAYVERFRVPSHAESIGEESGVHWAEGWFWRGNEQLFSDACVRLRGRHNKENICAVIAAATVAGAHARGIQAALEGFVGLPFRLQDEGVHAGIRWINDSISTAPQATAAALRAYHAEARTLIVGGFDRGYDVDVILAALAESQVERVIALPVTGHRLAQRLAETGARVDVLSVPDLAAAVAAAAQQTPQGSVCLFSPGAPSYGFFRDFAERGRHFASLIRR